MATYNANTLQDLLDKRNYIGAADYLSTQRAASPQKQIILNRRINQLRRDGAIQAAMLQGMTPDEQKAFHFISAIDGNGRIPHSTYDNKGNVKAETINIFGDNYVNPRIRKQINEYVNTYNFTYSGILKALTYFYEIKEGDKDKANNGIGIVPYVYKYVSMTFQYFSIPVVENTKLFLNIVVSILLSLIKSECVSI